MPPLLPPLLSLTRLCLRFLFLLESLVASFPPPLLSTFYEASLRIQTRQPSTSTTIHRRRLRRLTLLEMQRLRRMFENVFSPSPSFLLSLSLSLPLFSRYICIPLASFPGKATPRDRWKSRDRLAARNVDEMLSCSSLSRTLRGDVYPTLLCLLRAGTWMMMERSPSSVSCVLLKKEEWMWEGFVSCFDMGCCGREEGARIFEVGFWIVGQF